MMRVALGDAPVAAVDAVMIGDSVHDMGIARAARLFALRVGWGYQAPDTLAAAGAETVTATPADLVGILDQLWGIDA